MNFGAIIIGRVWNKGAVAPLYIPQIGVRGEST